MRLQRRDHPKYKLICPKCQGDKPSHKSYCKECQRVYERDRRERIKGSPLGIRKKRVPIDIEAKFICPKCLNEKDPKKSYCPQCYRLYYKENRNIRTGQLHDPEDGTISRLVEFVDRIEGRGGMASLDELMVEMIGLFNDLCVGKGLDILPVRLQLIQMWSSLKKIRNKKIKNVENY